MKKKTKYLSACCLREVTTAPSTIPDFFPIKKNDQVTRYFVCSKCFKPCDVVKIDFSDVVKVLKEIEREVKK